MKITSAMEEWSGVAIIYVLLHLRREEGERENSKYRNNKKANKILQE